MFFSSNVFSYICKMKNKKCNECLETKPVSCFGKEKRAVNGYKPRCKDCLNAYYRLKYLSFKEQKTLQVKSSYVKNKPKILKERKIYYEANKPKILLRNKLYLRKRKIEYPYLRTLSSFRTLVKKMLNDSNYSTFKYLGYSFDDLINTLGRLPIKGEHIDHKIPISWFNESAELKLIFSLENLQILTANENIVKGNRYSHKISSDYFNKIKPLIKEKYLNKINHG